MTAKQVVYPVGFAGLRFSTLRYSSQINRMNIYENSRTMLQRGRLFIEVSSLWVLSGDLDHAIPQKFDFSILVAEIDQRHLLPGYRGNHT